MHARCSLHCLTMASGNISYLQKADVLLDGKNYKAWSFTLWVFLQGSNLWGHIDRTKPTPSLSVASEISSHSFSSGVVSSHAHDWAQWHEDDARAIKVLCQSWELPIRLAVCDLPTTKIIWDHLRRLYLPSSQSQKYSLLHALSTIYQRDRSVQDFYAELSDLW